VLPVSPIQQGSLLLEVDLNSALQVYESLWGSPRCSLQRKDRLCCERSRFSQWTQGGVAVMEEDFVCVSMKERRYSFGLHGYALLDTRNRTNPGTEGRNNRQILLLLRQHRGAHAAESLRGNPGVTRQADEKRPSAALPSSLVIATYWTVRLTPRDFGCLDLVVFDQPAKRFFLSPVGGYGVPRLRMNQEAQKTKKAAEAALPLHYKLSLIALRSFWISSGVSLPSFRKITLPDLSKATMSLLSSASFHCWTITFL